MVLGIISDGYTERAWLAGVPHLYPRVEFSYRPFLQEQLVAYQLQADKLTGLQLRQFAAGLLAAAVVEWDLKDGRGNVVPIDAAAMLRLKDRLFQRLLMVVSTLEPPDGSIDPDARDLQVQAAALLESVRSGRPVAACVEEAHRKN